jgi:putative acetyltransferase
MSYTIRRAVVSDADGLTALFTDPSVIAGTLQLPFASPQLWRDRLSAPDAPLMLVACTDEGTVVGNAGLHTNTKTPRRAHAASIGMGVMEAHQRKGVGSKLLAGLLDVADNWYGLTRIELSVYTDNIGAITLYKKFGFQMEGTFEKYSLRAGVLCDCYTMARIRARPQ